MVADQMPIIKQAFRELALGFLDMLLDQALQQRFVVWHFDALEDDALLVDLTGEAAVLIIDEGHAPGHAGPEVLTDLAQDHRGSAGIFSEPVGAATFDHDQSTGVADGEPFTRLTSREQLAG